MTCPISRLSAGEWNPVKKLREETFIARPLLGSCTLELPACCLTYAPKIVENKMLIARMTKELKMIDSDPPAGICLWPKDGKINNLEASM